MKERVKDVLSLAASVCGREDLAAYLAGGKVHFIPCAIELRKGEFFNFMHKAFLSVAISLNIIWEFPRKLCFKFCVFCSLFFIRAHIIAESQMSSYIVPVAHLKDMDLMGSFISAFAQIAATLYSEFAEIFIADFRKGCCNTINLFKASYRRHNINHRLCR